MFFNIFLFCLKVYSETLKTLTSTFQENNHNVIIFEEVVEMQPVTLISTFYHRFSKIF